MNLTIVNKLLSIQGRINRTELLAYAFLISLVYYSILISISYAPSTIYDIASFIIIVLYIVSSSILIIKRVHDYDETAWYALLMFIPIVNLYIMLSPGSPSPNRYGKQPAPPSVLIKILAALFCILPFVLISILLNLNNGI